MLLQTSKLCLRDIISCSFVIDSHSKDILIRKQEFAYCLHFSFACYHFKLCICPEAEVVCMKTSTNCFSLLKGCDALKLLNINAVPNFVSKETHNVGHVLDEVFTPVLISNEQYWMISQNLLPHPKKTGLVYRPWHLIMLSNKERYSPTHPGHINLWN